MQDRPVDLTSVEILSRSRMEAVCEGIAAHQHPLPVLTSPGIIEEQRRGRPDDLDIGIRTRRQCCVFTVL
jgi:hypothetical protein